MSNKKVLRINSIFLTIYIVIQLFLPIFLLRLFESGWWMIFCYPIYLIIAALHGILIILQVDYDKRRRIETEKHTIFTAFSIASFIFLLPVAIFPVWAMNNRFLDRIEYLFGFNTYTSYEGGLILFCAGAYALGYFLYTIYNEGIKYMIDEYKAYSDTDKGKNGFKKSCRKGVLAAFFLFSIIYGAFFITTNNAPSRIYRMTQADEERWKMDYEINQKIEYRKEKKLKEAINRYKEE